MCLFISNDIGWAQIAPNDRPYNTTTLAVQSAFNRITPFLKENDLELDFKNTASVIYAAGCLRELIIDNNVSDEVRINRAINKLNNERFRSSTIKIEEGTHLRELGGRQYRYAVFNFGKRPIHLLFLKDYGKLPAQEQAKLRRELRIRDDEQHYIACPGMECVWFINPDKINKTESINIEQVNAQTDENIFEQRQEDIVKAMAAANRSIHLLAIHKNIKDEAGDPIFKHEIYEIKRGAGGVSVRAVVWRDASALLPEEIKKMMVKDAASFIERISDSKQIPIIEPDKPILLLEGELPKAWGAEIPFTMVEKRFVADVTDAEGRKKSKLPDVLKLFSGSTGIYPDKNLVLLKILRPGKEPRISDLYLEVHWEKHELYQVTDIDRNAWPDGKGKIVCGLNPQLVEKYKARFGDRWQDEYKKDFRVASDKYKEEVYEKYAAKGLEVPADVDQRYRDEVYRFVGEREVEVGDVVVFPAGVPHSLRHGIEVAEVLTFHYERGIIVPTPFKVTSGPWDTDKAFEAMVMSPYKSGSFGVAAEKPGAYKVEDLATFPIHDRYFTTQRITLSAGANFSDSTISSSGSKSYQLLIGISGSLKISSRKGWQTELSAKKAVIIPENAGDYNIQPQGGIPAVYLKIYIHINRSVPQGDTPGSAAASRLGSGGTSAIHESGKRPSSRLGNGGTPSSPLKNSGTPSQAGDTLQGKTGDTLPQDVVPGTSIKKFLHVVDESDNIVGRVVRGEAHKPPFPIHRAASVIVITKSGNVVFQRRSSAVTRFKGALDIHGGHLEVGDTYDRVAYHEIQIEFPIKNISFERFKRIRPGKTNEFFKVRIPEQNNENKAIFIVALTNAEDKETERINERLKVLWDDIYETVAKKLSLAAATLKIQSRQGGRTELWQALQEEFKRRLDAARSTEEKEFIKMAREVEEYASIPLNEAISLYFDGKESFADGFYSLFDIRRNKASETESYRNVIEGAIDELTDKGSALQDNAHDGNGIAAVSKQSITSSAIAHAGDTLQGKSGDTLPMPFVPGASTTPGTTTTSTPAALAAAKVCPILTLNAGSSTIKYQLIDMLTEKVLMKGEKVIKGKDKDYETPVKDLLAELEAKGIRPVAVGHRVVHGGQEYSGSVLIDDKVIDAIDRFSDLAPLHNPPNLAVIRVCKKLLGGIPNVAVFDTAFHQTMPEVAYRYAIPTKLFEEMGIRRYGFHGTSHRYVAEEAAKQLGKNLSETNLITVHLGNGSSITAVKEGRSIDTSMGLTPLEGVAMGTRSGDLDSGIVLHLLRKGYSADDVNHMLNKESGLLGISGLTNEMRDLIPAAESGNPNAKLAIDIFIYRILKYIGSYQIPLERIDAVVLTGGIGGSDNAVSFEIERRLNKYFKDNFLPERTPKVLRIITNEEFLIARDSYEIWKRISVKEKIGTAADFTNDEGKTNDPASFASGPAGFAISGTGRAGVIAEAARIHEENLKVVPTIPQKTILCHIIADSILPAGQWNMLSILEKNTMTDKSYTEKIIRLRVDNAKDFTQQVQETIERIKGDCRDEYKGCIFKFDVACPNTEFVKEVLESNLGVKALAFEPNKEVHDVFDVVQVEGIILALRALYSGRIESLREAFKILAGTALPPELSNIADIDEFMKRITFSLPASKVEDYNLRRKLNIIIRKNIETAA